jgi:hypothetical protein
VEVHSDKTRTCGVQTVIRGDGLPEIVRPLDAKYPQHEKWPFTQQQFCGVALLTRNSLAPVPIVTYACSRLSIYTAVEDFANEIHPGVRYCRGHSNLQGKFLATLAPVRTHASTQRLKGKLLP